MHTKTMQMQNMRRVRMSKKPIPKDKQIIITDEYKMERIAHWSEADEKFATAMMHLDMYEGKWNMNYYENEYIKEENILSWREF